MKNNLGCLIHFEIFILVGMNDIPQEVDIFVVRVSDTIC